MGFSREEYWSGLPFPPPGIEPLSLSSPALAGRFFTTSTTWKALMFPSTFLLWPSTSPLPGSFLVKSPSTWRRYYHPHFSLCGPSSFHTSCKVSWCSVPVACLKSPGDFQALLEHLAFNSSFCFNQSYRNLWDPSGQGSGLTLQWIHSFRPWNVAGRQQLLSCQMTHSMLWILKLGKLLILLLKLWRLQECVEASPQMPSSFWG